VLFSGKKRKKPFFCSKVAYNVLSDKNRLKANLDKCFRVRKSVDIGSKKDIYRYIGRGFV
jgi:hypothetical protein